MVRGEITSGTQWATSRTATPRDAVGDGRKPRTNKMGDGGRPGSEALPAQNRENSLRLGRATRASSDMAARRHNAGRIFAWRAARSQGARTQKAASRTATPHHAARRRARQTLGDGGRPGNEALQAENHENGLGLARAARAYSDMAARRNLASHIVGRRKTGARRARSARCGMATGEKKRWAAAGGRAARCCRQRTAKTVRDLSARREHLRIWRAQRNNAGRIGGGRKTGARRARSAR